MKKQRERERERREEKRRGERCKTCEAQVLEGSEDQEEEGEEVYCSYFSLVRLRWEIYIFSFF